MDWLSPPSIQFHNYIQCVLYTVYIVDVYSADRISMDWIHIAVLMQRGRPQGRRERELVWQGTTREGEGWIVTHCLTGSYVPDLAHTAPAAISASSPTTASMRGIRTSIEEEEEEVEVWGREWSCSPAALLMREWWTRSPSWSGGRWAGRKLKYQCCSTEPTKAVIQLWHIVRPLNPVW